MMTSMVVMREKEDMLRRCRARERPRMLGESDLANALKKFGRLLGRFARKFCLRGCTPGLIRVELIEGL